MSVWYNSSEWNYWFHIKPIQFNSVAQSCPTLCDPMNCSTPGLPVHHQLPEFTQTHVHRVSDAIQPSHPLLSPLPPPIPPSIRVFSNESTLSMRWPKYWSFSLSISLSNEHPGLVSFRMDWLDQISHLGWSQLGSPYGQGWNWPISDGHHKLVTWFMVSQLGWLGPNGSHHPTGYPELSHLVAEGFQGQA